MCLLSVLSIHDPSASVRLSMSFSWLMLTVRQSVGARMPPHSRGELAWHAPCSFGARSVVDALCQMMTSTSDDDDDGQRCVCCCRCQTRFPRQAHGGNTSASPCEEGRKR